MNGLCRGFATQMQIIRKKNESLYRKIVSEQQESLFAPLCRLIAKRKEHMWKRLASLSVACRSHTPWDWNTLQKEGIDLEMIS